MRREKTMILSSVQDRRAEEDRTETELRPVRPILWDRRSRLGPVDRHSVGLWPSLLTSLSLIVSEIEFSLPLTSSNSLSLLAEMEFSMPTIGNNSTLSLSLYQKWSFSAFLCQKSLSPCRLLILSISDQLTTSAARHGFFI